MLDLLVLSSHSSKLNIDEVYVVELLYTISISVLEWDCKSLNWTFGK